MESGAVNRGQYDLARSQFGLNAPTTRAQQTILGDAMQSVQDVDIEGMPSHIPRIRFTGGLRPSLLGPSARAAGAELSNQALQALQSRSDVPGPMAPLNTQGLLIAPPTASQLPQATKSDSIMNALATIGGIANVAGPALQGIFAKKPLPSRPTGVPPVVPIRPPVTGTRF
jgi:hypothetical protein